MIRFSEIVLKGHPDKISDFAAEAIVQSALRSDPKAFVHVEASIWEYELWLTGSVVTSSKVPKEFAQTAKEAVINLGYTSHNVYNANNLDVRCSLCVDIADPSQYSHTVNDQCIAIGWAGYDDGVDFLPPEHYLGRRLAGALEDSFAKGPLQRHGPDGKILLQMREERSAWIVERVTVTVQQHPSSIFLEFIAEVECVLQAEYERVQRHNPKWVSPWEKILVHINPNGPLINGGPLSDNGQTGRKLVMDFFGPRVPIGGGALFGKDPMHIDRFANRACLEAARFAVRTGATECQVTACYIPNNPLPQDVRFEMSGRGQRLPREHFRHGRRTP